MLDECLCFFPELEDPVCFDIVVRDGGLEDEGMKCLLEGGTVQWWFSLSATSSGSDFKRTKPSEQ